MVSAAVFQRSQGFPIAFRCGSDHGQLCVGVTAAQQRKRQNYCESERDESSFSHIFLSIFSYFVGRSDFPSNRPKSAHFSRKMFDIFRVSGHFPSMKSSCYWVNSFLQILHNTFDAFLLRISLLREHRQNCQVSYFFRLSAIEQPTCL